MDNEKDVNVQVEGETTEIPVQPGDKIVVTLSKEEADLISEVRELKARKANEAEDDIIDAIDNTLSLEVPAVDGTIATIEIPEDADISALDDVTLGISEDVVADIVTLVGADEK